MGMLVPILLLLVIGWVLALSREGFRARAMIIASVPLGGFVGGYIGGGLCWVVLHFQGKGESHDDMIAFAAAGMFGMLVGGIVSPLIALFLTSKKSK